MENSEELITFIEDNKVIETYQDDTPPLSNFITELHSFSLLFKSYKENGLEINQNHTIEEVYLIREVIFNNLPHICLN